MQEFEATMMSNFLVFNIIIAAASVIASAYLAQRMRPGFLRGLLGFGLAMALALFIAAAGTWLVAVFSTPGMAGRSSSIPFGAFVWSLETGVEFALLGIAAGMLAYLILRMRRREQAE
jgi:hypothetical protein